MDSLIRRLQKKLKQDPSNQAIQKTLSHLAAARLKNEVDDVLRDSLKADFEALEKDGLIDATDAASVLEDLRLSASLESNKRAHTSTLAHGVPSDVNSLSADDLRYVEANLADTTIPRLPISSDTPAVLPVELMESLKQTYFLHMLAMDPVRVLPPGKSLLSVLSRPHSAVQHGASALQQRVENLVHAAFWDEAYESLSNPVPSVQLSRLKRLYEDVLAALSPLLPSTHPVIITLSLPLSPTSSPLRSAVTHLREIIQSLRERCAPSRDSQVDSLMSQLDTALNPTSDLARIVVDVVRAILKVAEEMKDDLSQFVLGTMGEQQLHEVIVAQAAASERELVLQLWRPPRLQELWAKWLDEVQLEASHSSMSIRERFVHRLMQALGKNEAIFCNIPMVVVTVPVGTIAHERPPSPPAQSQATGGNALPPPLFFTTTTLLQIQNYLQALVIAASLRSLVRLSPLRPSPSGGSGMGTTVPVPDSEQSFVGRIWTLLKAEIEGKRDEDGIKIVNLADEVVRVRRLFGGASDAEEETKLRAAVDRTLQVQDPVFELLQRRLTRAIAESLLKGRAVNTQQTAPVRLRTGRSGAADNAKRPARPFMTLDLGSTAQTSAKDTVSVVQPIVVKGFEDPILISAIGEIAGRISTCIAWTEYVWTDLFESSVAVDAHS